MNSKIKITLLLAGIVAMLQLNSCSKDKNTPDNPPDICAGKTINVSATATPASACGADGSITVAATGSTGFSFKLNNNGTYQSSPTFDKVAAGSYTLFAKDADGCEKTTTVSVASTGAAGPLFTNVKTLMTAKCVSCHNNSIQNGGMNWQVDCNIVAKKDRIKARAVDIGDMPFGGPSLTDAEKTIITNWITAGGAYTD